jgi:hypothetical protein
VATTPIENALRLALSHPDAALRFVEKLQREQMAAAISEMSDEERALLRECLDGRELDAETSAIFRDLAARRERGELLDAEGRKERRRQEGWWAIERAMQNFARGCGLAVPRIYQQLNAFRAWLIRELLEGHGWTPSTAGDPLDEWAAENRKAVLEIWALLDCTPARFAPATSTPMSPAPGMGGSIEPDNQGVRSPSPTASGG